MGHRGLIVVATLLTLTLLALGSAAILDRSGGTTASEQPPFSTAGWSTDFGEHSVALDEFTSGGPPKDGIPSIDEPRLISIEEADRFLKPREPVAVLELDGVARAYPLQILVWHEIVNDEIAGGPVAVTYCPLCNSTVAFSRSVDGRTLEFGTTGMLRNSDLVMYDRQTESWWQQLTADAVVGELTGTKLEVLPSQILSWRQFRRLHPDGGVLSRETGFSRQYGRNPYVGYDRPDSQPFLFEGEVDDALPPKERVAAVRTGESSAAVYPFSRLRRAAPINDRIAAPSAVGARPIVVFFDAEVVSALDDSDVALGRAVGAAAVFARAARGRVLSFRAATKSGEFRDRQTGSVWNMNGRATAGPLAGARLRQIPHDDQFWFALAAFFDDADIRP